MQEGEIVRNPWLNFFDRQMWHYITAYECECELCRIIRSMRRKRGQK